jgi:O-antigen/teichoic acid export membrane protein
MIAAAHSLPWIIAFALGDSQTGLYFGCAMLVRIGAPLLVAIQNVLTPRAAAAFADQGLAGLRHVVRQTTLGLAVGMGLFATLLALGGGALLELFLGADYAGQREVVALLALNELAVASMLGAASGLTVLERTELLFRSHLAGIVVTVTLAFLLIGEFGLPGAAMAQVAGTAVVALLTMCCYRHVVRNIGISPIIV